MGERGRGSIAGAILLAFALGLLAWAAPGSRCALAQNLGFAHLAKGALAQPAHLRAAERWFTTPPVDGCRTTDATSYGLGQAYARDGRPAAAIATLRDGQARAGLREFLIGRLYEAGGQRGAAWSAYRRLPRDAAAHFYGLAHRADEAGDYRQALYNLTIATTINPSSPKLYYRAAFVYWRRLDDAARAADMIRVGLALPQRPSVERDLYRGLLCSFEADPDCAAVAWASAVGESAVLEPALDPRRLASELLVRGRDDSADPPIGQLAFGEPWVRAR